MKPPLPANEQRRLEALRRYEVLDTPSEPMFDDIAFIASVIAQTPIALMSLIDSERQWFKARVGLDSTETPREHAFCSYTILGDDTMIVEDARQDARFANNPLVTASPHIRFYAGAPLSDREGNALGSLCVIDQKPRTLDETQQKALAALSRSLIKHLELKKVSADLAKAVAEVKLVRGLLPMCAHCKGIRNDDGYFDRIEDYIRTLAEADFTHTICPACLREHFPEAYEKMMVQGKL